MSDDQLSDQDLEYSGANRPMPERGVVINELLCHATQYMSTCTREQLQKCVYRFYTIDEVIGAKKILHNSYSPLIGDFAQRKTSANRSELLAHVEDVLSALYTLDQNNVTFRYVAYDLKRIPVGDPSENDYLAVAEKMVQLEKRLSNIEFAASENKASIMENKEHLSLMDKKLSSQELPGRNLYSDVVVSGTKDDNHRAHPSHNVPLDKSKMVPKVAVGQSTSTSIPDIERVQKAAERPQMKQSRKQDVPSRDVTMPNLDVNNQPDDDDFERTRDERRRQARKNRQIIKGTAGNTKIKGGPPPNREFFVYRLEKGTRVVDLSAHLVENKIKFSTLEQISNPDAKFCSFRLSVPFESVSLVTDPAIWPKGVSVRRFYNRSKNGSEQ